jgi:CubicO group peptidase (beta-lactamase class C family)
MALDDQADHWAARLGELATESAVAGAALGIWRDGEEILVAHGVLSTATGVAVTPNAVFQIGSITKVWTATMIMQLIEAGRLSLDATVADVLPGVCLGSPDASGEVTVRHLLTHTSGIDGDIFTDTGRGDDCVETYVDQLSEAAWNHPVGAAYSYCNSGFVVLGRMIEVLDGRGWDASLKARLVGPLGLGDTVTLPEEAILHRAAVGHREHPNESDPVSVWALTRSLGPVGLITASVHDVLAFARLHLDGGVAADGTRLLSPEGVAAMQEPQRDIPTIDDRGDAIGLAWRVNRWSGRRIFGHDGGTIGQLAYLRIDPAARLAVCLLTNASVSEALYLQLFSEIFTEYVGVAPPRVPEPVPGPDDPRGLARHVGRYERALRRYDVTLTTTGLRVVSTMTGDPDAFGDPLPPEELDLHPTDATGDHYVCRSHDHEPWTPTMFDRFPDGTPYLYLSGRATPRR